MSPFASSPLASRGRGRAWRALFDGESSIQVQFVNLCPKQHDETSMEFSCRRSIQVQCKLTWKWISKFRVDLDCIVSARFVIRFRLQDHSLSSKPCLSLFGTCFIDEWISQSWYIRGTVDESVSSDWRFPRWPDLTCFCLICYPFRFAVHSLSFKPCQACGTILLHRAVNHLSGAGRYEEQCRRPWESSHPVLSPHKEVFVGVEQPSSWVSFFALNDAFPSFEYKIWQQRIRQNQSTTASIEQALGNRIKPTCPGM